MVLESCMILLDNSEHMRNGDYIPTRLEAQHDAANFLIGRKTQSNPENTVGVISMSGKAAELLVSPTDDMGKILGAVHKVEIVSNDSIDLTISLQVASLALKHRRNKNGGQRIIVFCGSPLGDVENRALVKAGKMLKKNNVSIDIVAMGQLEENQPKLKELVDAANGNTSDGDSHLVTIPAGVLPSDVLISSPIVGGGGSGHGGGASGGDNLDLGGSSGGTNAFAEYGGVDPNMDPELAMALRVSMEEERARQERIAAAASAAEETKQDAMDIDSSTPAAAEQEGEEDALLQQALAMSMAEGNEEEGIEVAAPVSASAQEDDDDEDAAIQLALQMSMQPDTDEQKEGEQFQDPNFVNQLLGSLPGVNASDPAIHNALMNLQNQQGEKKEEDKDEDKSGNDK